LTAGRLLDGWLVVRGRLAAGTGGELRAEIDGSGRLRSTLLWTSALRPYIGPVR